MQVEFKFEYQSIIVGYGADAKIGPLGSEPFYSSLRKLVPGMHENPLEFYKYENYEGPFSAIMEIVSAVGQTIEVKKVIGQHSLAEDIRELTRRVETLKNVEQVYNKRCNVHVPGLGLLLIEETYVETDACTELIDKKLEEGWRILAVCPQPDQRRPDYVMGRNKRQN